MLSKIDQMLLLWTHLHSRLLQLLGNGCPGASTAVTDNPLHSLD